MIDRQQWQRQGRRDGARLRLATLVTELGPDEATESMMAEPGPEPLSSSEGAEREPPGPGSADPPWTAGPAGRLVERWVPGGTRAVDRLRAVVRRRPAATAVTVAFAVAAAVGTGLVVSSGQPAAEAAPPLPAAVSITSATVPASTSPSSSTMIVISVVGKVTDPGLVTLPNGARVADAVRAAGGVPQGTDLTSLNLAQRLADGEQVYVGIPVPPQAGPADAGSGVSDGSGGSVVDAGGAAPALPGKKGGKADLSASTGPGGKVDLNTASADELQTLPGVGPATAQKILDYRSQHGNFTSVDQLQDISGIGDGKYSKLKDLVTV